MKIDNTVSINIPWSNPLFQWVIDQRFDKPISYATLTVDGIESRLALVSVPGIVYAPYHPPDDEDYLVTEWRLLRSN